MSKFRIVYFNGDTGKSEISRIYEGNKQYQKQMKEFYNLTYNNVCSRVVPPSGGPVWSYLVEK